MRITAETELTQPEHLPSEELRARWEAAVDEKPHRFSSEIARDLRVSEGELLATRIGRGSVRLRPEWPEILRSLEALGEVKSITRNEHAVLEINGQYPSFQHFGMHSMFVGDAIDMRLTLHEWRLGMAVRARGHRGRTESLSLQFFGSDGTAVHKIFLLGKSRIAAFEDLVTRFSHADQSEGERFHSESTSTALPDSEIDRAGLLQAWAALEDTHGFFGLLHRFDVTRPQAMRLAEHRFTRRVANSSVATLLKQVADDRVPLMVFVGNKGCLQIHKGLVKNIVTARGWLNVMESGVELQVQPESVADSWVVEKPTADGSIWSLELFDARGRDILSLFGVRAEGKRQSAAWRASLERLTADE